MNTLFAVLAFLMMSTLSYAQDASSAHTDTKGMALESNFDSITITPISETLTISPVEQNGVQFSATQENALFNCKKEGYSLVLKITPITGNGTGWLYVADGKMHFEDHSGHPYGSMLGSVTCGR